MRGVIHNSDQNSIFDAIAANELAVAGMDLAATNANAVLEVARGEAVRLGRLRKFVTADDVQHAMIARGYSPQDLGNAAGSVFRGKHWKWDGQSVRKSERVSSHGRLIRVWEYVGN